MVRLVLSVLPVTTHSRVQSFVIENIRDMVKNNDIYLFIFLFCRFSYIYWRLKRMDVVISLGKTSESPIVKALLHIIKEINYILGGIWNTISVVYAITKSSQS